MKQSYSTKQLAKMWDVSESTIKRWADAGMLKCRKTIGGHRKFELEDIIEFQNQCDLAKKEIIAGNKTAEGDGELRAMYLSYAGMLRTPLEIVLKMLPSGRAMILASCRSWGLAQLVTASGLA